MRTMEQDMASKKMLSRDIKEIRKFIEKYRSGLSEDIFNSQEYSIRLIQIPKILNKTRVITMSANAEIMTAVEGIIVLNKIKTTIAIKTNANKIAIKSCL